MFITLYPNFFKEGTDWCNEQTMGSIPGFKPLLDNDLRRKLNFLGESVRGEIKQIIDQYSGDRHSHQPGWERNRMWYLDEFDHETYEGHRFCEAGMPPYSGSTRW